MIHKNACMKEHGFARVEIRIFLHYQLKLEAKASVFPSEHKKGLGSLGSFQRGG